jgi:hypothetical protein
VAVNRAGGEHGDKMGKVVLGLLAVVVIALAGGVTWLAFWDIPAPNQPIERVLPDARFPK